jgi:hypothetical protein
LLFLTPLGCIKLKNEQEVCYQTEEFFSSISAFAHVLRRPGYTFQRLACTEGPSKAWILPCLITEEIQIHHIVL